MLSYMYGNWLEEPSIPQYITKFIFVNNDINKTKISPMPSYKRIQQKWCWPTIEMQQLSNGTIIMAWRLPNPKVHPWVQMKPPEEKCWNWHPVNTEPCKAPGKEGPGIFAHIWDGSRSVSNPTLTRWVPTSYKWSYGPLVNDRGCNPTCKGYTSIYN